MPRNYPWYEKEDGDLDVWKIVRRVGGGIFAAIFALIVIFGSWFTVDAGHGAIVYNKLSGDLEGADPGFHIKWPLFESVTEYETRSQLYVTDAEAASGDLQDVHTQVAVRFHPEVGELAWIHQTLGTEYADRVIKPGVQEAVKASTARYKADALITQREAVKAEIVRELRERLESNHLVLDEVDITDFDFSDSFNAAIEAKVTAEQKAFEEKNKLLQVEYSAQQQVIQATAQADATRATANATAYKIQKEAEAQAEAARIVNEALAGSPWYIEYLKAQRWDGKLPTFMGGGGDGGAAFFFRAEGDRPGANATS